MGLEELKNLFNNRGKPKEKKQYRIPKVSARKKEKDEKERQARGGGDTELQKWYKERQKQLTGQCCRCGDRYNSKDLKQAITATAHILPKRTFASVATHPNNWIEFSAYCGCHNWFDNYANWDEIIKDPIGEIVIKNFIAMWPNISTKERHKISDSLLNYIYNPF